MSPPHNQSAEVLPFGRVIGPPVLQRIIDGRPDLVRTFAEQIQKEPEDRLVRFFREQGDRCVWFVIGFTVACISICVGANLILWVGR